MTKIDVRNTFWGCKLPEWDHHCIRVEATCRVYSFKPMTFG